jgi:hypothetical protein
MEHLKVLEELVLRVVEQELQLPVAAHAGGETRPAGGLVAVDDTVLAAVPAAGAAYTRLAVGLDEMR